MNDVATIEITNKFVTAIENGMADGKWTRPWAMGPNGFPTNPLTDYRYSGTNAFILLMNGGGYWATYKQWSEVGGQVQKGERGTTVLRPIIKKDPEGLLDDRLIGFATYAVFSLDQIDGWSPPTAGTADRPEFVDLTEAESFVAATGAKIVHSGETKREQAFYVPSKDYINMPDKALFDDREGYYSTLLHELAHWSGHESRLDRELNTGRFGNEAYAVEELVAELASTFLSAHLGVHQGFRANHAKYLKSWLVVLKNDSKALMTAASQAEKAFQYLSKFSNAQGGAQTSVA